MRLFLCYTPLHALIAKRLIETENLSNCIAVYVCFQKTEKHEYYFNQLSKSCEHSYFLTLKHSMLSDVFRLTKFALKLRFRLGSKWELFTGNIKHFHSRFLMLLLGIKRFNTFDDGSGNVSGAGYFYELEDRKDIGAVFSLIAPRLLYKNIIGSISQHYTIYDFPNVFSPTRKIPLLGQVPQSELGEQQARTVYLANAFSEDGLMTEKDELAMDGEVLKRWPVTDVLMHPRSNKVSHFEAEGASVVRSNLIAEDYILSLISQGCSVTVIGIYSSTLLNLLSMPSLNLINFEPQLNKPTEKLHELLIKAGVKCIEVGGKKNAD
jgi:hypothetical protein